MLTLAHANGFLLAVAGPQKGLQQKLKDAHIDL
jgi:hypothetical protein